VNESELRAENHNWHEVVQLLNKQLDSRPAYGTAPCGHDERFCEWEDHGKPITCTVCEIARLAQRLAAAELLLREACAEWCEDYGQVILNRDWLDRAKGAIGE
jgi:hypothetical protein